jgi:hypothetical protein
MKRRTLQRKMSRVKKTEARLLKALQSNRDVRGNIFDVPTVKRAMKLHNTALRLDQNAMPLKHPFSHR